ncbi:putative bifunctional diguanylate cyclase/phosphodiesterase, partial [Allosphingosinicella sp.]|uniref:putative bifunctional diguanylate cyclase/phosphodiesterase n=1 Tax=Allosphingosinicella sp. TaxID=2823234 RepID=UPI002F00A6FD
MEAVRTRGRSQSPGRAPVRDAVGGVALSSELERLVATARQDYLDALPIAAAIIALGTGDEASIDCANEHFRHCAEWDERVGDRAIGHIGLLSRGTIGTRVHDFMLGEAPALQFDSDDGRPIGGRHFTVRLARLKPTQSARSRCLISLIDKTAQVETEKNLRSEMLRDSLTGLPNRLAFNEHIEAVLEDPAFSEGSYAVLVVDMTRFSRVNECMGAIAGDELLITFARRLFSALRPSDVLARTAGDEFGILLRLDRGLADAMRAAERIKAVLTLPFRLSELEIRVDCAIGCAILSRGVGSADEVLRNAQFALKRAKRFGTTQIYEANQAQAVRRRFSIETELRRAIEGDELELAFQPLIELATGRVAGFEALARWNHEEGGAISPSEFIPVAEECGLIVQLGRWALDSATRTLADWDSAAGAPLPIGVSVNLSAIQITRDDVAGAVASALRSSRLPGGRLTLELTESAIIQDPGRATEVLRALQELDVRVAMDDFGTGYTSLAYLQRLPIDVLKIDRSFVSGMLADGDSTAIVRAILSLASALGMEATAEGIDAPELAEVLTALGCTYGQ